MQILNIKIVNNEKGFGVNNDNLLKQAFGNSTNVADTHTILFTNMKLFDSMTINQNYIENAEIYV